MADGQTEKRDELYERSSRKTRSRHARSSRRASGKTDYAISLYRRRSRNEPDKPEIRSDLAAVLVAKRSRSGKRSPRYEEHCASIRINTKRS